MKVITDKTFKVEKVPEDLTIEEGAIKTGFQRYFSISYDIDSCFANFDKCTDGQLICEYCVKYC